MTHHVSQGDSVAEEPAAAGQFAEVVAVNVPLAVNDHRDSAVAAGIGPAGNALPARTALSARTALPETLRLRNEEFGVELRNELKAVGFIEDRLVDELARHAAGMELAGAAEGSVLRHCGRERAELGALLNPDEPVDRDACLTAAIANVPMERLGRYRTRHERAFYGALGRLRDLQATRRKDVVRHQFARFKDEHECADYLLQRARRRDQTCPRCGHRSGNWLACRRWECSGCGRQVGIRSGSLMEGSRLPLALWFLAIGEVLADPAIRPERLQQAIGLPRLGTVRKVLRLILAAMRSPEVDRLLAGLDRLAAT